MPGVALAGIVAALFYSSFLTNPAGVLQPLLRREHLPRSRNAAGQPRAPVALLPGAARVFSVWRAEVERRR